MAIEPHTKHSIIDYIDRKVGCIILFNSNQLLLKNPNFNAQNTINCLCRTMAIVNFGSKSM